MTNHPLVKANDPSPTIDYPLSTIIYPLLAIDCPLYQPLLSILTVWCDCEIAVIFALSPQDFIGTSRGALAGTEAVVVVVVVLGPPDAHRTGAPAMEIKPISEI